jgi:MFS family permease
MGVCFAVASILGPLVGGALSDHVSWRWCFYINLPIGGIALALIAFLVDTLPPYGRAATYKGYSKQMLIQLRDADWIGAAIVLSWGVCFILGLEWGGIEKSWKNASTIACLVMIPVLLGVFFLWEWYYGKKAMLPLHILLRKNIM